MSKYEKVPIITMNITQQELNLYEQGILDYIKESQIKRTDRPYYINGDKHYQLTFSCIAKIKSLIDEYINLVKECSNSDELIENYICNVILFFDTKNKSSVEILLYILQHKQTQDSLNRLCNIMCRSYISNYNTSYAVDTLFSHCTVQLLEQLKQDIINDSLQINCDPTKKNNAKFYYIRRINNHIGTKKTLG